MALPPRETRGEWRERKNTNPQGLTEPRSGGGGRWAGGAEISCKAREREQSEVQRSGEKRPQRVTQGQP